MKSRKWKRFSAFLLTLVVCFGMLAGCGSSSSSSSSEESGDESSETSTTVEISIGSTYGQFIGPFDTSGVYTNDVNVSAIYLVYDVTFYRDADGNMTSDILTEYYVTDDQSSIVMTLRDDIYFSNGDQMTAEDLKYSLVLQAQVPRTSSDWANFDCENAVVSDDGLTLTIPFVEYRGDWQSIMYSVAIQNESWIEENGGAEDFDYTDISLICGSGPYYVTDYSVDISCTYEKRDDWWQDGEDDAVAQAQTIICYYYTDSTTMIVDYENGVIDAALNITADDYDYIAADSSLGTAKTVYGNDICTIWLDSDNTPELADVNVRIAMAMGTDAESITAVAYGSLGVAASGYMCSNLTEYFTGGYLYDYDPEGAIALLEENGISGIEMDMIVASGTTATIAEAWAAQMAEIGITINLKVYEAQSAVELWREEGGSCAQLNGGDNDNISGDPATTFTVLQDGGEFPAECKSDEYLNELIVLAANGSTTEERKEYYAQLEEYIYENAYGIPLSEWMNAYCYGASGKILSMDLYVTSNVNLREIQVY